MTTEDPRLKYFYDMVQSFTAITLPVSVTAADLCGDPDCIDADDVMFIVYPPGNRSTPQKAAPRLEAVAADHPLGTLSVCTDCHKRVVVVKNDGYEAHPGSNTLPPFYWTHQFGGQTCFTLNHGTATPGEVKVTRDA